MSNDFIKSNLFNISKLIIIWFLARPLVLDAARVTSRLIGGTSPRRKRSARDSKKTIPANRLAGLRIDEPVKLIRARNRVVEGAGWISPD